jgi:predicted glycoside hydrolase/deacetylase ChbG (UPF0249 family)
MLPVSSSISLCRACLPLFVLGLSAGAAGQNGASLAERLGHSREARLLIVNADDVGMSHASNVAVFAGMEKGLISSGTIMVPCPWFLEAAAYAVAHPQAGFGVHLTHTSEWRVYRWRPILGPDQVPGLVDEYGYLWAGVRDLYAHGTPEQAEREARAQIETALAAGIDVTHLDTHMGALNYDPAYFPAYLRLARDYRLPLRMASQALLERMGAGHWRQALQDAGILCPDYLIHGERGEGEGVKDYWLRILHNLKPGVTELYIHPAVAGEEMRHITGSWQQRDTEYRLFLDDPDVRRVFREQAIDLVGYRQIRDLQRAETARRE